MEVPESEQCDAYARYLDTDGRETVLICSLMPHDPQIDHHDFRLQVRWRSWSPVGKVSLS